MSSLVNWGGGLYLVLRPVYLVAAGFSVATAGALISLQIGLAIVLSIPISMLSDARGRKRIVFYGVLMDSVGSFLFFYSADILVLIAAQASFAFVNAAAGSPFAALYAEGTTEGNRNDLFVLLGFVSGMVTAVGGFASGLIVPLESAFGVGYLSAFRLLFLAVSVTSLLGALVMLLFVKEEERSGGAGQKLFQRGWVKLPKKSMKVVKKFSIVGLIGFGAGLIVQLLPIWYQLKFGVGTSTLGLVFGTIFLTTGFASLLTPALARRNGSVTAIVASQLSAVVLLVAVPLAPDYGSAGAIMVARSTLANMANPIVQSFTMGLVDPGERATAYSIIQLFDQIPRSVAPTIGGILLGAGFIDLPFFITAGLYVASSTLFYFFFRKTGPVAGGSAAVAVSELPLDSG